MKTSWLQAVRYGILFVWFAACLFGVMLKWILKKKTRRYSLYCLGQKLQSVRESIEIRRCLVTGGGHLSCSVSQQDRLSLGISVVSDLTTSAIGIIAISGFCYIWDRRKINQHMVSWRKYEISKRPVLWESSHSSIFVNSENPDQSRIYETSSERFLLRHQNM